ncbi:hypothetical protein HON59_01225 [bacterium]|jgi:hypothetical protein|nr:hypothetical protein [bacterium]MBT3729980.1 hypothetical protein [bacterium]MBT4894670.1 hypothetical protein [bacterium]
MSRYSIIITIAVWVIILPFLGFPSFWETLFLVLSGFGIIFYTFMLKSESANGSSWSFSKDNDVYVENGIDHNNEKKIQKQK